MKKITLSCLGILSFSMLFAQHAERVLDKSNMRDGESVEYCTSHKKMAEARNNPELRAMIEAAEAQAEAQQKTKVPGTEKATIYKIPIVFHVLHSGGAENISREQLLDAVAILNRDYRLQNADAAQVQAAFQGMPTDVEIEFALATKAPNGQCFSGITRTVTPLTFDGSSGQAQVNAVVAGNDVFQGVWPHNKYLNIYVCADIGGAAGYTFNPFTGSNASAQNMFYNGVFVLHNYTGSIGTSSVFSSRTLTHEVGHWLNLSHVWGGDNNPGITCGTDNVNDTPATIGSTSCALNTSTCSADNAYWGFDQIDQVENYMDYSYCSKMFSAGQVTRMRNAAVSNTAGRSNIWTTANLNAVGVGGTPTLCKAQFGASKTTICVGETVNFTDQTYNAATGWTWTLSGATPATSTVQNPSATWTTPGLYTVTLNATDGSSSDAETMSILVLANNLGTPYYESFENISTFNGSSEWSINNPTGNGWTVTNTAGNTGTNSAKLTNFNETAGSFDDFYSGNINLSSITAQTGATFSFRYAFRKRQSTNNDVLKVYFSEDCGSTWDVRKTLTASTMSGTSTATTTWTPTSTDWVTVHMTNLLSNYWNTNFRYRFEFKGGGGNNVYVDDINIYAGGPSDQIVSTVGLDEINLQDISLYPNPADNEVYVRFTSPTSSAMSVVVTDLSGKQLQKHAIQATEGSNLVFVSTSDLAAGSYLLQLVDGATVKTLQFIVK